MVSMISLIVGVLSLITGFIFFVKSKKIKSPVYLSRTTRLIYRSIDQIDKLEILYDGVKQPAMTITKLAFWNKGRETIQSQDLTSKDQLRIEIDKEYDILSCDILTQTKKANDFRAEITEDKRSIIVNFDYLDYQDGVVLKIRHTGWDSNDLVMKGSIKGATIKEIISPDRKWKKWKIFSRIAALLFFIFFYILFAIFVLLNKVFSSPMEIFLAVTILALCGSYVGSSNNLTFELWNYPVPKALARFFQSEDF